MSYTTKALEKECLQLKLITPEIIEKLQLQQVGYPVTNSEIEALLLKHEQENHKNSRDVNIENNSIGDFKC